MCKCSKKEWKKTLRSSKSLLWRTSRRGVCSQLSVLQAAKVSFEATNNENKTKCSSIKVRCSMSIMIQLRALIKSRISVNAQQASTTACLISKLTHKLSCKRTDRVNNRRLSASLQASRTCQRASNSCYRSNSRPWLPIWTMGWRLQHHKRIDWFKSKLQARASLWTKWSVVVT